MPSQDELLTILDVAGLLKVSDKTVYSLVKKSNLPCFKVGGQWRFSRAAIDSWIEGKINGAGVQLDNCVVKPSRSSREN